MPFGGTGLEKQKIIKWKEEFLQSIETPYILIIDDDPLILIALEKTLKSEGYQVIKSNNGKDAIDKLHRFPVAVMICDYILPDISGLEIIKEAIKLQPDCIRIVLTGVSDLKVIEQLINVGQISQFIVKPGTTPL